MQLVNFVKSFVRDDEGQDLLEYALLVALIALVSVDPRVEAQVTDLMRGASVTSWSDRLGDLGGALWSAARDHSIDSAPLLIFATVGVVLTVFMLKS